MELKNRFFSLFFLQNLRGHGLKKNKQKNVFNSVFLMIGGCYGSMEQRDYFSHLLKVQRWYGQIGRHNLYISFKHVQVVGMNGKAASVKPTAHDIPTFTWLD